MNKFTAALLAVFLVASCVGDVMYTKAENIKAMQNDGVARLQASVDLNDYREAEQNEIQAVMEQTEASIRESKEQEEIDSMIDGAVSKFAEFKTDAQYTKEEEEEAARQAELERQRQEEEAARQAAAAAKAKKKKSKKKKKSSNGCVGGSSDNFY